MQGFAHCSGGWCEAGLTLGRSQHPAPRYQSPPDTSSAAAQCDPGPASVAMEARWGVELWDCVDQVLAEVAANNTFLSSTCSKYIRSRHTMTPLPQPNLLFILCSVTVDLEVSRHLAVPALLSYIQWKMEDDHTYHNMLKGMEPDGN